jgi:hypothetical protein
MDTLSLGRWCCRISVEIGERAGEPIDDLEDGVHAPVLYAVAAGVAAS